MVTLSSILAWKIPWKEEREKAGLKLNIQKIKIMASGPITLWQIEGEKVETVAEFIFLGSKITADGDCSRENKRHLMEKEMATLSSILAWKIPWTEEPGGPQSMRSEKVRHNLVIKAPPQAPIYVLKFLF